MMLVPTVVAVVDAELGYLVRLTSYVGGKPVSRDELENVIPLSGAFRVDLPTGLPVTDAGPLDDVSAQPPRSPCEPVTLGSIIARQAAAGAARVAKNLLGRLGPHDPV
jgi:hypothetical protein